MALRPIICMPDPRLRLVSKPVESVDDAVRALMDDMLETMYDAPGIGLAAIQIAEPVRVVVIDLAKKDDPPAPMFFVNPEILWASEDKVPHEEGCLSIPEYFEEIERPARVKVRYLDRQGVQQEIEAEGLLATCLQHEIDHLNGVLFVDYLSRLKRERVLKKFQKAARRGDHAPESAPASQA
jgi:peptide deformylase